MCRIWGQFGASVSPRDLRRVGDAQRHGGPDAQWIAAGPGWGLGIDRLAIVDPAGGVQPYRLGAVTVVFNGELYNHAVLRAELSGKGHVFEDACDGSILPALYCEHGLDFTERLEGMYAVAVVDLRDEPTLVLATDHAGMKSLYYTWDPARRSLRFSSELPALLAFPGVGRGTWLPGLDSYLATRAPFGERTLVDGVRTLPSGSTAVLSDRRGLRLTRRPAPAGERLDGTIEESAELVRDTLAYEVGRLLTADVPVCTITSGGLDSSLVTALAAPHVSELHTFNIAYTGTWPADERHFAREVSQRSGTVHHQVLIDPATFPDLLPKVVRHLGQPNADPITLSTYSLFQAVHEAGFTVALTGDAADELFGGYRRVVSAVPGGPGWRAEYAADLAAVPAALRRSLYTAEYADFLSRTPSDDALVERALAAAPETEQGRLDALSAAEIRLRMPAYHLRRVDHLSMAHSVEARVPFCQPSVMRLAARLPVQHKITPQGGKRALQLAARGLLPDSVLTRPKQPFTLPITAMLHAGSALMTYAREVLAPAELASAGQLDPARVRALLDRQEARPDDKAALAVWSLLVHQLWLADLRGAAGRTESREAA